MYKSIKNEIRNSKPTKYYDACNSIYKSIEVNKAINMPYLKMDINFTEILKSLRHKKFNKEIND